MNEAQHRVLDDCYEKLSEHFDSFVLVTNIEQDGNNPAYTSHYGGFHTAMGLLYDALNSYSNRQLGDRE